MSFKIRPYKQNDYEKCVSLNLKEEDRLEILASDGEEPEDVIKRAIEVSNRIWVIEIEGNIEGVLGVREVKKDIAIVWLLSTDKTYKYKKCFMKETKALSDKLSTEYSVLFNYVDSRYKKAIKWLKWMGYEFDEVYEYQLTDPNTPFYLFYKLKEE